MKNDNLDPRENAPVKHMLTQAERQRLQQLHAEQMQERRDDADRNLAKLVKLGQALRQHKG